MNFSKGSSVEYSEKHFLSDEKAFEFYFHRFYRLLTGFCLNFIPVPAEAEDVVQEVFISLWDKKDKLHITGPLKHYLLVAVKNRALDKLRSTKRPQTVPIGEELDIALAPEDKLGMKELNRSYIQAVKALSPQCRIVFVLCRFESYTYAETAELLGITVKTVENHMGRALRALRETLLNGNTGQAGAYYLLLLLPAQYIEILSRTYSEI